MARFELITNALTGLVTQRPYTAQEEAVADAIEAATLDFATIDQAALNAALAQPGSVVRALALLMLQRINAIDAAINALNTKTALAGNNLPIFTQAQLVTALQALMR